MKILVLMMALAIIPTHTHNNTYQYSLYRYYGSPMIFAGKGEFLHIGDSIIMKTDTTRAPWFIERHSKFGDEEFFELSYIKGGMYGEGALKVTSKQLDHYVLFTYTGPTRVRQFSRRIIFNHKYKVK